MWYLQLFGQGMAQQLLQLRCLLLSVGAGDFAPVWTFEELLGCPKPMGMGQTLRANEIIINYNQGQVW